MKRKAIYISAIVGMTLPMAMTGHVSAGSSFSAFYNNPDFSDSDAVTFVNEMRALGYAQKRWMNVFATSSTNYPTADAMINADDSEFIYISGHGMKDTELWVGPLSGPTDAFAASYSANTFHTDPHSGKLYNTTKEIGVDYQDTYHNRTYSKWDDQAKWVFFAACSQLDYGSSQGIGNYWYSLSNAQIWARTMLGYRMENGSYVSKRIHGINGYHESAPAGDKATTAIDDFFDEAVKGSSFDFAADTVTTALYCPRIDCA